MTTVKRTPTLRIEANKYSIEGLKAAASGADFSVGTGTTPVDDQSTAEAGGSFPSASDIRDLDPSRASVLAKAREEPSEEALAENLAQQVERFGIRDWSREPYGAAAHAWRPGVKSWEVLERLKAFSLSNIEEYPKNIHICGEAYSDYHGFIEGALRSAANVLNTIE